MHAPTQAPIQAPTHAPTQAPTQHPTSRAIVHRVSRPSSAGSSSCTVAALWNWASLPSAPFTSRKALVNSLKPLGPRDGNRNVAESAISTLNTCFAETPAGRNS
jgi:hypothetical protein